VSHNTEHRKNETSSPSHIIIIIIISSLQQNEDHPVPTMTASMMTIRPARSATVVVALVCLASSCVMAFPRPSLCLSHSNTRSQTTKKASPVVTFGVIWDPSTTDDSLVEFPTAAQKKVLRLEASKRQARKEMSTFSLPESETGGPFSKETMASLMQLLNENELVEVRGVSKTKIKQVFTTLTRLSMELEMEMQKNVCLVRPKGHSGVLYSPVDDEKERQQDRIKLHTSVGQKNVWIKRSKAPRDNRGQIVKEE
jgi:hypothetical protein